MATDPNNLFNETRYFIRLETHDSDMKPDHPVKQEDLDAEIEIRGWDSVRVIREPVQTDKDGRFTYSHLYDQLKD